MVPKKVFGLIDCNNFYVSCERIFNPEIRYSPVIVLSNNDGCVIARSDESKKLGIKMGIPYFEINDLIEENRVVVFSTNYTLYGDISKRVMNLIASMVEDMEIYSIDEAFIDVSSIDIDNLGLFGEKIKKTIYQWLGIPVSIGFGETKTLAKIANYLAKKDKSYKGILNLVNYPQKEKILKNFSIKNVWGIGSQYLNFFDKISVRNAFDLMQQDENRVREHLGLMGQRIILEIRGVCCYPLNNNPIEKKEFTLSRSFGKPLTLYEDIETATASYVRQLSSRLRKNKCLAKNLIIFAMTNKYTNGPRYVNYHTFQLPSPTNDTFQIVHYSLIALKKIYREGYLYKKTGIIVQEVVSEQSVQMALWDDKDKAKHDKLSKLLDQINNNYDGEKMKLAIEGIDKKWKMRQNNLSPKYTTNWNDLLKVDMDQTFKK